MSRSQFTKYAKKFDIRFRPQVDDTFGVQLWDFILSALEEQRKEERKMCFDLFDEILNEALGNKEMADDPSDPKIRIMWLKSELKGYLDNLSQNKQNDKEN